MLYQLHDFYQTKLQQTLTKNNNTRQLKTNVSTPLTTSVPVTLTLVVLAIRTEKHNA